MNLKYTYDKKSLIRNDRRWFPMMGEIHYSRVPQQYWKEALLKMKAGGVDIVSSYVIWIHHEEIENEWDFSGQRDLRKFVSLVAECGMTMILRIGPWCHGEVRNGGFPDWLLHKNFNVRTNDEKYFDEVTLFYKKIFSQVKGLLLRDGGPIIGVQIENEFGHCGGLWGSEGEMHMKRLYEIARSVGFIVPLYTATGWGGAITAGLLPVMGGYCDAPWDARTTEIEPSGNFIFTYERNDHAIGSDYGLGEGITFDMKKVPYLTAELGGGLQVTYKRRPVATASDIGAMSLVKMGSGCNLLGYYMYHGGTNPVGKKTTLEENTATGYPNDLPVLNYDFRAPIGEYGDVSETFCELRLFALFLHEWGELLCDMNARIPKENPLHPADTDHLRYTWRTTDDGKKGFVFVNNYVRRQHMMAHQNIALTTPNADIVFPSVDVHDKDYFFLPFNFEIGSNILRTALTTPLCVLHNERPSYVFYKSVSPNANGLTARQTVPPIECRAAKSLQVSTPSAADTALYQFASPMHDDCDVITLSREDALKSAKITAKKEFLIVTDDLILPKVSDTFEIISSSTPSFCCWPELQSLPKNFIFCGRKEDFYSYKSTKKLPKGPSVTCVPQINDKAKQSYLITVEQWPVETEQDKNSVCTIHDVQLVISYTGNGARLYENGALVADHLFIGPKFKWQIGLRKFGTERHSFILEIDALTNDKPLYLEEWPVLNNGTALELCSIESKVIVNEQLTL